MSASPWSAGRLRGWRGSRLLFGAMYEDVAIEDEVLRTSRRVFVIGAAGDTALHLGRGDRRVTAVDVNPAQAAYLEERLRGGPRRSGAVDRLLRAARLLAPAAGWTRHRVDRFLHLSDVEVQARVYDRVLATARYRALLDVALSPAALLRAYRPEFVDVLPPDFGRELRGRLRRGIATHANRSNPYARLLFAGEPPADGQPSADSRLPAGGEAPVDCQPPIAAVEVHTAEAAAFLENQRPGAFDGFTLSNVLDGPGRAFRTRLARAVARAGTPDAPVVLRTLRPATDAAAASWAARDRAMIWGGILVTTAADFPAAVEGLS